MMDPDHVVRVLDALDAADVRAWVEGGWGVDALIGRQTRDHDDMDLAIDSARDGFAVGRIGDRDVPGLTAALQIDFHSHYDPRPVDHHDLALLAELTNGSTR